VAQKVEDLAMAAEKLKEYDDIVILVIGEGPDKEKLKVLKDEKSLNNFIIFPIQKRKLMPLIISSVNICTVLLSNEPIFEIAIPTKFYEYLCCRKPLIGICRGEVELIIKNNNIGFSCESGEIDKLVSLILRMRSSQELLSEMEKNALSALQKFSLDTISKNFYEIIEYHNDKNFSKRIDKFNLIV
jgi:glycosyltransferase involved in cell wall biosynthesis